MRFQKPNARYQHVFVVVRLDGDEPLREDHVTLTKAFFTEEAAEAEAKRLNELNAHWVEKVLRLCGPRGRTRLATRRLSAYSSTSR